MGLLALGACSGGEKIVAADGSSTSVSNRALTPGDSTYLAGFVSAAASSAMAQMRAIRTPQLPGFGSSRPACTPQSTTAGTDANSNGIPDDQTTTYAAASCSYMENGATTTAAGSIHVQDLGGLIGFRVTYTDFAVTATKADTVARATINGSYEYRYASTTSGSAVDNSVLRLEARTGQGSITLTRTSTLTGTLTPISGAFSPTSFPGSTMAFSGTLSLVAVLTGNQVIAGQPTTITYNVAVHASTDLRSPSNCSATPSFTGGVLDGTVTGTWRGALRVAFTVCGNGVSTAPGTKR